MVYMAHLPRVLVVDDESIIADTLVLILNKSGFDATAAYSGEQALEMASAVDPELLISDVGMRGIDGIETAIRFRNLLPACNVVLFSGQAHAADLLHDARERGYAFELLKKPVDPAVLLNYIHSLFDPTRGKIPPHAQSEEPTLVSAARNT